MLLGMERQGLREGDLKEISNREKLFQELDNSGGQFFSVVRPTVVGVCVSDDQMKTYEKGWNLTPLGKKITDELNSHPDLKKFVFLSSIYDPHPQENSVFLEVLERYGGEGCQENTELFAVCCWCDRQIIWVSKSTLPSCVYPRMKGPGLCAPCYDDL